MANFIETITYERSETGDWARNVLIEYMNNKDSNTFDFWKLMQEKDLTILVVKKTVNHDIKFIEE